MVRLAKWIRENVKDSRVLIITDRIELDEQIEGCSRALTKRSTVREMGKT
jgi:type I site-specific restriction-modification system R (restriction) subunit